MYVLRYKGGFSLCTFNRQFSIRDHRINPPLFSEREGYASFFHIGPYCFMMQRIYATWEYWKNRKNEHAP